MKKIRVEILVTNGDRLCRLAWLENSKERGVYGGFIDCPENLHFSYHMDGTVHTKVDSKSQLNHFHNKSGYASCGLQGPPLNNFSGYYTLMQGGVTLDDCILQKMTPYKNKKVDRLILLDSRTILKDQKHLCVYFDLIEANNYKVLNKRMKEMQRFIGQDGKSICEHHCYFEQNPWIVVHLAYQSCRVGFAHQS